MTTDPGADGSTLLSPDEAFTVLGDETRLQILQALGEAAEPLAYAELFDRVEYDDTANFPYHLDKLTEHFVRETDQGYLLRLPGKRVVEAIHSGIVTENPIVKRTAVDADCMYCGSSLEIGYHEEVVFLYCTECAGEIERVRDLADDWPISSTDVVGYVSLPPAGVHDRTPSEVLDTAGIRTISSIQSIVRGVCPRCSGTIDRSASVCPDHDPSDGFCDSCGHQFGLSVDVQCTDCIFATKAPFPAHALGNTDLMGFMIDHGIDPISPDGFHLSACTEEIVSTDPPKAKYTFTVDDDSLTLTVDDHLAIVDVTRSRVPNTEEGA